MKYFLVAGEASGDMHGAALMRELTIKDPNAQFWFLGGDAMSSAGGILIRHYRDMAFMGFVNVLLNAFKIIKNFRIAKQALRMVSPDVVILIDYPGFNMKLSTFIVNKLSIPVYYYIAPKVWAWKTYRVRQLKREMSGVLTIFPFETDFFKKHGLKVHYVGNPTVDAIHYFLDTDSSDEISFRESHGLSKKPIIALLPGSRRQEISACLPEMLRAAFQFSGYTVIVSGAPGIEPDFYSSIMNSYPNAKLITGQTYRIVHFSVAAVVNSGTASLETALLSIPQVVVYHVRGGRFAYWLKDRIIKIPYISLVNILMNRQVVTELVAHLMTAENIAIELKKLLRSKKVQKRMLADYFELQKQLGEQGTASRAADFLTKDLIRIRKVNMS